MSADRYLPAARHIAQAFPGILAELGFHPVISRCVLTETPQGSAWLFVVLELDSQSDAEAYAAPDILNFLSARLQDLPVVISETDGLRYAVLLGSAFQA